MKKPNIIYALVIFVFILAFQAGAVMEKINVQGRILVEGVPLTTATGKINVRLIDESTGIAVWDSMYSGVVVNNGIFNLQFGDAALKNLDWTKNYSVRFAFATREGVSLLTVVPDQKLDSVPYAFLTNRQKDGYVDATGDPAVKAVSKTYPTTVAYLGIGESGVSGYIPHAEGRLGYKKKWRYTSTSDYFYAYHGVYASSEGDGVYASSDNGYGVYGTSGAASSELGSGGVYAESLTIRRGEIKIPRSIYYPTNVVNFTDGQSYLDVSNILVTRDSNILLSVNSSNTVTSDQYVWVENPQWGSFRISRSSSAGALKVCYLIINTPGY